MAKAQRLTGTAEYELFRLQQIAAFDKDVQSYIAEYMNVSIREVNAMLAEATELSVANDIRISGVKVVPYSKNKYLQQLTAQIEGVTSGAFENLTDTLAFLDRSSGIGKPMSFRQTLTKALDGMELSVSSGLESYDAVIRRTVKNLAKSGVIDKTLFYINEKGTKTYRSLDVVVRQTMFGGLRLMTRAQAEYNAGLLETDVFQITWHAGHRESHGWGGKRYSLSGSYGLPTLDELYAQYGGGRLDDYGCRHDIIAVDPNAPPLYSDEELTRLEAKEKEIKRFNSTELDRYVQQGGIVRIRSKDYSERTKNGTLLNRDDQEQRKREYERAIRSVRREQTISKDILENALPEDQERLKYQYYALKNKNNLITKEYETFCKKMGFPTEKNRIYYDGKGRLGGTIPKKYRDELQSPTKKDIIEPRANPFAGMTAEQKAKTLNDRHISRLEGWAKAKWGVTSIDLNGLDAQAISATFKQMDKAISEYPELKNSLKTIIQNDGGLMATDFSGNLSFNPTYYAYGNRDKLIQEIAKSADDGFSPKGTSWMDIGVHEIGHRLNAELIRTKITPTLQIENWNQNTYANYIITKALKSTKFSDSLIVQGVRNMFPQYAQYDDSILLQAYKEMDKHTRKSIKIASISRYSTHDNGEALAEAFLDNFINKGNANILSKNIINELLKELR